MSKLQDKCYDPQQLKQLLNEQLAQDVETDVLKHLDNCHTCQTELESLAAEQAVWDELPSRLAGEVLADDEQMEETCVHESAPLTTRVKELRELLGPTDHPNMLGRIGTYEVCGVVGQGSTGIVLKSFEPSLNRYVAIKLLSPTLSSNGAARKRFEREARAIAAVVHEHVVPIFAVDEHQGLPYFVMQYVSGASLQHRIERQGPLDPCEVVRISMQIASGLAAAHAQGIVHRDIKPANILLEHGLDRVLVSDFGLARVTDGATVTLSGMIAGTPSYMAPEQARGEQIDQRSDLFSLGSVMYAMCTAAAPFPSETVYGVIRRICEAEPRPIRESTPEVPEWLESLIRKLLSKQKEDRFESADQVAAVLSQELAHLQNPTLVQTPPRLWSQSEKAADEISPKRIGRGLVAAMGCLAILLIGSFAAGVLSNGTAENPEQVESASPIIAEVKEDKFAEPTVSAQFSEDVEVVPAASLDVLDAPAKVPSLVYPNAIAFAYPIEGITVDGDASDWPAKFKSYPLERAEVGNQPRDNNDLEARFRVGYNSAEHALYVVVEVQDDSYVLDPVAGQTQWNAQDGCELYIDSEHRPEGSPLAQYTRYGDSLNAYGSNVGIRGVDLKVGHPKTNKNNADPQSGRCYEWRIDLPDGVQPGRSLGMDVALLDKDGDGSFTWLTWGSGTQKIYNSQRCGDVILIDEETQLGKVAGRVVLNETNTALRPRVRLTSLNSPKLWTMARAAASGDYKVTLPVGEYSVEIADGVDHHFEQAKPVKVTISEDQTVDLEPIQVSVATKTPHQNYNHNHNTVAWGENNLLLRSGDNVMTAAGDPRAANDSIALAYPVSQITVDGDLSDWPKDLQVYPIAHCEVGENPQGDDDASASFRVGYNVEEQAIYVAVEVDDDSNVVNNFASKDWTAQDGNEIYLDDEHRRNGSNVEQFSFYGTKLQHMRSKVLVKTSSNSKSRVYEWRIKTGDIVSAGRSMGFDVSILDRDEDESFSYLAWGRGTQKAWYAERCGNLLLVDKDAEFGAVSGKIEWTHPSGSRLPRVCFQSLDASGLRPRIACDTNGNYSARLPSGSYLVSAIGHRSERQPLTIEADQQTQAEVLTLKNSEDPFE